MLIEENYDTDVIDIKYAKDTFVKNHKKENSTQLNIIPILFDSQLLCNNILLYY